MKIIIILLTVIFFLSITTVLFAQSYSEANPVVTIGDLPFDRITAVMTSPDFKDQRTWYISGTMVSIYDPKKRTFSNPIDLKKYGLPFNTINSAFKYKDNIQTFYSNGYYYSIYNAKTKKFSPPLKVEQFKNCPFKSVTAVMSSVSRGDYRLWFYSGVLVSIYEPAKGTFSKTIDMKQKKYPLMMIAAAFKYRDGKRTFYSDGIYYVVYTTK